MTMPPLVCGAKARRAAVGHDRGPGTCFPQLAGTPAVAFQAGWDSEVFRIADQIVRIPRRSDVEELAWAEARLLPMLSAALPMEVPVPREVCADHAAMRYRRIPGEPATADRLAGLPQEVVGDQIADLLTSLRSVSVGAARDAGVPDLTGSAWGDHYAAVADGFARMVVPCLPPEHRVAGEALLASVGELQGEMQVSVVHADLGPSHLLCDDGGLRGVIDWGDVRIGDPALDLAWVLNGAPQRIAGVVRDRVVVDEEEIERARLYHRLGPWYEVEHGLRMHDDRFVASGVRGIVERLRE